jgi:hypothetical protein
MSIKLKTSYAYPWALVTRNGQSPGKRPNTRMAFITEAIAEQGHIVSYKAFIGNDDLAAWTRHPRDVEPDAIVKAWRVAPSKKEIRKAKARLKVQP